MEQETSDQEARNSLIEGHISYAKRLAQRFYRERSALGISVKEYQSAALLGLCQAAQTFQPERGLNFRTFSFFRIKGAMCDLLRRIGPISFAQFRDLRLKQSMSEQDDMCELEPVALAVELHSREVLALRRDEATPEEVTAARADASSVRAAIAQLTPLEQAFLQNHYFEQRSYSEFEFQSRKYSKSGLCRIHRQALKRLRRKLRWLDPSVSGAAI